ncbi:GNAT family N-acetyltransferase [Amphibacillus sediminis]|uniref:GNAT family N-acetyltransferase n=1 Tax=Amphibacillus sediminis TaxID=360185 RepID=UPI00278BBB98|nr:GNAT family N-acetyltransferase [Amphibacillus sediminis]
MNVLSQYTIKALNTDEELIQAFPIMQQLRPQLNQSSYLSLVKDAQKLERYQLHGLIKHNSLIALVGFKPMVTLYYGHFVWVCDLITDHHYRSQGFGEQLLNYVHNWADQNGYSSVALSSGLNRTDAHRFYEQKMTYTKASYVFKYDL